MSFTDQKPWVATQEDCELSWGGGTKGKYFRCNLCGHRFVPGDVVRWVYTNSTPGAGGNPFTCEACDGPDVVERWKQTILDAQAVHEKYWWFRPR